MRAINDDGYEDSEMIGSPGHKGHQVVPDQGTVGDLRERAACIL